MEGRSRRERSQEAQAVATRIRQLCKEAHREPPSAGMRWGLSELVRAAAAAAAAHAKLKPGARAAERQKTCLHCLGMHQARPAAEELEWVAMRWTAMIGGGWAGWGPLDPASAPQRTVIFMLLMFVCIYLIHAGLSSGLVIDAVASSESDSDLFE